MSDRVQSAERFGKVAVLMGGRSAEREISLQSGTAVLNALQQRGVDAQAVDTGDRDFVRQLSEGAFARAFNALHGRGGEDGVVQGLLQGLGIPCTGSGVLGSALAMDKLRTKQLWEGVNLPTPAFVLLRDDTDLHAAVEQLGFPMMLKPSHEGSSIGMTRVEHEGDLQQAWQLAGQYDREVLAERWVEGAEYTTAIVDDTLLPLIRLETPRVFYDYEAKYEADSTCYHCPCGLPPEQEAALQHLSKQAFDAVGASGWGRVDLFVDSSDHPWLIEVNTVPGMTDHSLVPMAAAEFGWSFDELVWRILETSMVTVD
ncbi:MAG TPA: D-alanine--D-alanine ligase [Gammaproteobacteria bacterium]|nr:D-alanine--D-alanine ligase [Gammaproteobacteria bacterium]